MTNNSHYKKDYQVMFEAISGDEKINFSKGDKIYDTLNVECSTGAKFLIVSPLIEREKGLFGCSVHFDRNKEIDLSQTSLQIRLLSQKSDTFSVEARHQFKVITPFKMTKKVDSIYLNKSQRGYKLHINSNQPLLVNIRNDKNLTLNSIYDSQRNLQIVDLKAIGDKEFDDLLSIRNENTDQRHDIKINFKKQKPWLGLNFSI